MTTRTELRDRAYAALDSRRGRPVAWCWRTVMTDTESLSGFGPVCGADHPDLGDGLGQDHQGAYDCCPPVVETFSVELAAYLVSVLNQDADMNPQAQPCGSTLAHPAHDYRISVGPVVRVSYTCPGLRVQDTEVPR